MQVSRRTATTVALGALLLSGCGTSDAEYEGRIRAACQDNQSRAFRAALDASVTAGRTKDQALDNMRTYIAEVRKTPVCFVSPLRDEVERAAKAAERGELLKLEYPTGIA